jgi:hypothetical protein
MTQKFNTGKTFATGEQVTAQDLEDIVELATPLTALTDDQSLTVVADKITVKDGSSTDGVPLSKMQHIAARSVICNIGSSTASPSALSIPDNQVLKGSATGLVAGTIDNDNLTNNGISIDADSGTTHEIDLGETLTVTGGEGIDTTITDNTLTIAGENATTSNKGVASFNTNDFSVSSGAVSIATGGVSNDQLAGSIANAKLANSSVTVSAGTALSGGGSVSLGGSTTLNVSGVANAQIASNAAIATSKLAANTIGISAGTGLSGGGSVSLGGSTTINLNSSLPSGTTLNGNTIALASDITKGHVILTNPTNNLTKGSSGTVTVGGYTIAATDMTCTESSGTLTIPAGTYIVSYNIASFESDNPSGTYDRSYKLEIKHNNNVVATTGAYGLSDGEDHRPGDLSAMITSNSSQQIKLDFTIFNTSFVRGGTISSPRAYIYRVA